MTHQPIGPIYPRIMTATRFNQGCNLLSCDFKALGVQFLGDEEY